MASKVCFNIKNVHYAVKGQNGYGTPVAIPGAVNLTFDPEGEESIFWADGIKYYINNANNGYSGELECALIPDSFRKDVLGEIEDTKHILFEKSDAATVYYALGFQIDGDDESTYFWFYNCTASRPSGEAGTTEDTKEPDTQTLAWTCNPDDSGYVRAKSTASTAAADITAWFTAVVAPTLSNG